MSVEEGLQSLQDRRNEFYRNNYRRVQSLTLFLVFIGLGLAVWLGYVVLSPVQPNYYITTATGEVTPLHSLSQPMVTNQFILKWSSMVARSAYSFNFANIDNQVSDLQKYFTDDGWSSMNGAYQSSDFLSTIRSDKLISDAVVDGPAVILNEYLIEGIYTWEVEVPIMVTYTSASAKSNNFFAVTLVIQRSPTLTVPNGIQVDNVSVGTLNEQAALLGKGKNKADHNG